MLLAFKRALLPRVLPVLILLNVITSFDRNHRIRLQLKNKITKKNTI